MHTYYDKTNVMQIILASSSPSRSASLKKLGLPFHTNSPSIDETPLDGEDAVSLVKRLSIAKAHTLSPDYEAIIIAGDQVLSVDDCILSKPHTFSNAQSQLRQCSGKIVYSYSGMCVYMPHKNFFHYSLTTVEAHYRELSENIISSYLTIDEPYQCAGSIRFESHGHLLLKKLVCSDTFAICGLPLHQLVTILLSQGITLDKLLAKNV